MEELQLTVAITVIQRKVYERAGTFERRLMSVLDHERYGQQSTVTCCDVYTHCSVNTCPRLTCFNNRDAVFYVARAATFAMQWGSKHASNNTGQ